MKSANKFFLILAAILTVLGGLIFTLTLAMEDWNIMKLSNDKFKTNTYEFTEEFKNININIDTADIQILPSETENTTVICKERIKEKHIASVTDDALNISFKDNRHWTDYISFFSFGTTEITVYLPKPEYSSLIIDTDTGNINIAKDFKFSDINVKGSTGDIVCGASARKDIKIKVSTGDITLSDITAKNLKLTASTGHITAKSITCGGDIETKVSTGKTELNNVACRNLESKGTTGNAYLTSVFAEEKLNFKRSTGDIKLTDCDAAEIEMETSTGNIKGNFKTSKIFITATDTGKVKVPETTEGGKCKLTTDTGDIIINVE